MSTGFEFVNLKETTPHKESFMRKIKLLGIATQLHDIRSLLKQKEIGIALNFVDAAIDYIDINGEMAGDENFNNFSYRYLAVKN